MGIKVGMQNVALSPRLQADPTVNLDVMLFGGFDIQWFPSGAAGACFPTKTVRMRGTLCAETQLQKPASCQNMSVRLL